MPDSFIGLNLNGYTLVKRLGAGVVGTVYKAVSDDPIQDDRAIKLIKVDSLRQNWKNEIRKVTDLRLTAGIVRFHSYVDESKAINVDGESYIWIMWDLIPGTSLREFITEASITIPMLLSVVESVLRVLHACSVAGVQHGDLHAGNVLIQDADPLAIEPSVRTVWVTDFGYLSVSMGKDMLDDFVGLSKIIDQSLEAIDPHTLGADDRRVYADLKIGFKRLLLETNRTEGVYVRNPRELINRLKTLGQADNNTGPPTTSIADYLAAELLGERFDEWKRLFVPDFIAQSAVLDRNITVVTGLRGCGKTMIFRRLTALYDLHLGPSAVPRADTFIGLYLNARGVAEAFPWLPDEYEIDARPQVLHYFHVSWALEICEWLIQDSKKNPRSFTWLFEFFNNQLGYEIPMFAEGDLASLRSALIKEQHQSRLGSGYQPDTGVLTAIEFLDDLVGTIKEHTPSLSEKHFYFFLDDYSAPLLSEPLQRILNPVVFRRPKHLVFKIATESVSSFLPTGLNGKLLEENDDYVLIDFGMQAMLGKLATNRRILSAIVEPRIARDKRFQGAELNLLKVLGKSTHNNIEIAEAIRSSSEVLYHGENIFCRMWSSDVREMIRLFSDMVQLEKEPDLKNPERVISKENQNTVMRDAGSRYLSLLEAATNPNQKMHEVNSQTGKENSGHDDEPFGYRLKRVAEAVKDIARHELTTKTSKNGDRTPPKQARRIEILDVQSELPADLRDVYDGLLRYGLFTRDTRGKSVRGAVAPRLYLRGILVPYFVITFSKRDSISMSWEHFCQLLRNPEEAVAIWKQAPTEQKSRSADPDQKILFDLQTFEQAASPTSAGIGEDGFYPEDDDEVIV